MTPDKVQHPARIRSRTWHRLLAIGATAGACGFVLAAAEPSPKEATMTTTMVPLDTGKTTTDAIRPFHFTAPQAALDDLRRRIRATVWPERETVPDASQGVQLATMRRTSILLWYRSAPASTDTNV